MDGVRVIRSELLDAAGIIVSGVSTRLGGVSPPPLGMNLSYAVDDTEENVTANRKIFLGELGIRTEPLAFPGQVHSATVCIAAVPGRYPGCDALVTRVRGVYCGVSVADCAPLLLLDTRSPAVAAVHAGWRGTADGIAAKTVDVLGREFGTKPADLVVFLGPSAGSCCYNVGEEVAGRFHPNCVDRSAGLVRLDLKKANVRQLVKAGIPLDHIEVSELCTICRPDLFHSFRRDRLRSGRMMAVIGLP